MKTKKTKKSFAEENAFRLGAGGGSNEKFNINEIDMGIKDIIGQQLTGNALELDDDCMQGGCEMSTFVYHNSMKLLLTRIRYNRSNSN